VTSASPPTDESPPLDPERTGVRINLSTALLLAALTGLVSVAVLAGSYKNRIEVLEKGSDTSAALVQQHDRQLVELITTNRSILSHLESIDRKIEARK